MYSIDELKEIFLDHGTKSEEQKGMDIRRFMELNPHEPIPEHMTESFNICFALYAICDELSKLHLR